MALAVLVAPTAQALVSELAATAERPPAGLDICCHAFPFQCRIKEPPLLVEPTAQALVGDVAATPDRDPATGGVGTCRHDFPVRCRINAWDWGSTPLEPRQPTHLWVKWRRRCGAVRLEDWELAPASNASRSKRE